MFLEGRSRWRLATAMWRGLPCFIRVCFLCFWLDNRPTCADAALRAVPLERGWAKTPRRLLARARSSSRPLGSSLSRLGQHVAKPVARLGLARRVVEQVVVDRELPAEHPGQPQYDVT